MGKLPEVYRKSAEIVPSFPIEDIDSGLGIVLYYGATQTDSGGTDYILVKNTIYSSSKETRRVTTGTTTMNFDTTTFGNVRTAKGSAYIQFGAEYSTTSRFKFKVQKVATDGTTTTDITTSQVTSEDVTGTNTNKIFFIELPLTETVIGIGEKLRLNVEMVLDGDEVNGTTIGHDPQNRDGSEITSADGGRTQMVLYMSYKREA